MGLTEPAEAEVARSRKAAAAMHLADLRRAFWRVANERTRFETIVCAIFETNVLYKIDVWPDGSCWLMAVLAGVGFWPFLVDSPSIERIEVDQSVCGSKP